MIPPPASLQGLTVDPALQQNTAVSLPPLVLSPAGQSGSNVPPVLPLDVPTLGGSGISLSISLPLVPPRVVQQVQAGRYVDMRDLLADNVAVRRHFDDMHASLGLSAIPVSSRPRVREVSSLPSWVVCFMTFLAVGTTDPVTRERLAYAVLIVREAMRHGGLGWLEYDRLFRQQAALNPSLVWNTIHPSLQATTILSQRQEGSLSGTACSICMECDHVAAQCAMAQLQQQIIRSQQPRVSSASGSSYKICSSWNEGACSHPGVCSFRHVCSNCYHPSHPARLCRLPQRARNSPLGSSRAPAVSLPSRSA